MFSARTCWNLAPNPLAEAAARRRAAGGSLLDLTESNPTRVGLGFPAAELARALATPGAAAYDPDPLGLPAAREAICGYYRDRGVAAAPDRLVVTASTSEAYAFLFKLLADPGDEVLVPAPSYPLFEFLACLESVRTVPYPLRYDGEWHLDREALRAAVTARTRAVVVVSPSNPAGAYLKSEELQFLAEVGEERRIALLGDEVFADYPLEPGRGERLPSVVEQGRALAFSLSGASKVAAAPGLKIGWLLAGGEPALAHAAMQRLEVIADTFLSPGAPAQLALPAVLDARAQVQGPLLARLRQNLATLRRLHGPASAWQPLRVEGGWTAVLRVPTRLTEQEWVVRLVEEEGVLVHPGFFFDFPCPGYLALSLLPTPNVFTEGLSRVAAALDRW